MSTGRLLGNNERMPDTTLPVSYTHLDVYKRQGIHRLSSRAALVKSMKRKFNIKMNTACYGTEGKFKQAMDDVKRKDLPDPYAYSSWTRNVMRKRKRMKFTGQFKHIVKSGTSTERRFQALEVRFLRNLENKILLREHTDRKVKVKERNCKKVWKRRQKQLNAYMPGESCQKGRSDILFTYPQRERETDRS